ncbi:unnamed protein product [Mycena citricolor]|uniref:Uncharacterized protein n=1 Tax=Mycena citricolor TaxID=2018698 RepID=A0AAD2H1C9_9AGAR|nr:unnamed protein product [Mycena citricolor]
MHLLPSGFFQIIPYILSNDCAKSESNRASAKNCSALPAHQMRCSQAHLCNSKPPVGHFRPGKDEQYIIKYLNRIRYTLCYSGLAMDVSKGDQPKRDNSSSAHQTR